MGLLSGKRALVTGGARRIGRAIALELARAGADVTITYRESAAEAERVVSEIKALSVAAYAISCELRLPQSVREAVHRAAETMGGLDLLVNNAGRFETAALEHLTVEQWDAMAETNTRGPFLVAQAAFPYLKASRGRIVNIGSMGGLHPWATHAHYCTSKAALHMLSQTMAKAWAPEISVNCVAPGMIVFGEVEAEYQHFAERTPMKRNGSAEEVAAAVLFFATGPHFITGQLISVDGGLSL
ncbi:SDR family NAD(P)-dependent oxidoreductase [Terriglobus sp. 2YAB30_2]|uniref:SDR family NAD(P)-dependent oxidoreductase n=1 Tax=unclassified Terriglobus TaxID=2628988 RepID=UPI003F990E8B